MSKLNFKMRNIARLPKSKNIVIKITETLIKEMGELFNCHHCQNRKIIQSVRRIVACCYCCMFLDCWKVCQILHNQVQRSDFTQPRAYWMQPMWWMLALLLHIPCQLSELWAERRHGQSQQMAQTCVSGSAPEFVIQYWYDSWLRILIHMTTCCRKAPQMQLLRSAIEIA